MKNVLTYRQIIMIIMLTILIIIIIIIIISYQEGRHTKTAGNLKLMKTQIFDHPQIHQGTTHEPVANGTEIK